ncbi:hypothetical protein ACS0TY_035282 [Phlomoides rotata]
MLNHSSYIGHYKAPILTIVECKGLEFQKTVFNGQPTAPDYDNIPYAVFWYYHLFLANLLYCIYYPISILELVSCFFSFFLFHNLRIGRKIQTQKLSSYIFQEKGCIM